MVKRSGIYDFSFDELFPGHHVTNKNYYMNYMIRFIFIFASLTITSAGIMAQNTIAVHPGSKGIFIITGDQLPVSFNYRISRRETGQNDWQVVKTLSFPQNKETWEGRIFSETMNNREISLPDSTTTDMLWRMLKRSSVTDSLYSWGKYPIYSICLWYWLVGLIS